MENDASFTIEAAYRNNWEPVPEGEFTTFEKALAAMKEVEVSLGWRGLRIVDADKKVWIYGLEEETSDEDEDEEEGA
ncbi:MULTISPECIES: hypothetical protein [Stenotrophomonas]|uniref:hypothetical protein n=1 Tax=Stenotrophomonas TaxID=40323 RepID=UPI0008721704|nr:MULTISPECIES: hypothetical protein [Stenotrophomonas]OEZ02424.1 hypothetical protein BIY45_01060 [Stenotrophomonas sp. BIIR7]